MAENGEFDAIIIGAGQGGSPLARAFARAGRRTAIIERHHVGGTCVNVGCTPTKTMVASARAAYLARRAADFGVRAGEVSVDLAAVRERKNAIVESFRAGDLRRLEGTEGLELIRGEASFAGPRELVVTAAGGEERRLSADTIVIDTGSRPAAPPIPGLGDAGALDSTTIMDLDTLPEHLLVLGGGYVGLEFGQMFRRFGSRVTVVQHGHQLLSREDSDVAEAVASILREDGVEVLLHSTLAAVEGGASGVKASVRGPDGQSELSASHLLVAAGRAPNTDRLNLAAAGIATDEKGYIAVDERLQTNVPGVYGLGDVKGGPAFTHISYDDFRILRANLLEGGDATTRGRQVPYVVFVDPQLGRIGLGEEEAKRQGRKVRVARLTMDHVARALEVSESRGFMKVVVDAESEVVLGAAVLGIEGGELMAMLQIAMLGNLPYSVLRDATFAHPSLAESLNNLFSSLDK